MRVLIKPPSRERPKVLFQAAIRYAELATDKANAPQYDVICLPT